MGLSDFNPLPVADADGGALNLTRITGLGAALVAVLTTVEKSWHAIFGDDAPGWAKPVVMISVIAVFAVVAAADILARAYVAGRRGDIIPLPEGLEAMWDMPAKPVGQRDPVVRVVAVRFRRAETEDSEFLIVEDDKSTHWVGRNELGFTPS